MASQAAFSEFPPTLDTIPEELRVPESFGWTPGALGAACVLSGAAMLVYSHGLSDNLWGGGIVVGLGALFLWWEYSRRQRRTVLVPQGGVIGVYRKGAFDLAVSPGQIQYYKLHWLNTARFLIIPGAAAAGLISAAVGDSGGMDRGMWLFLAVSGATCLLIFGLVVHSRILLKHFYVPRKKGRAERILLTREMAGRIYSIG